MPYYLIKDFPEENLPKLEKLALSIGLTRTYPDVDCWGSNPQIVCLRYSPEAKHMGHKIWCQTEKGVKYNSPEIASTMRELFELSGRSEVFEWNGDEPFELKTPFFR